MGWKTNGYKKLETAAHFGCLYWYIYIYILDCAQYPHSTTPLNVVSNVLLHGHCNFLQCLSTSHSKCLSRYDHPATGCCSSLAIVWSIHDCNSVYCLTGRSPFLECCWHSSNDSSSRSPVLLYLPLVADLDNCKCCHTLGKH